MKPSKNVDSLLPDSNGLFLHSCDLFAIALKAHQAEIGIKHNTAQRLSADLTRYRALDAQFETTGSRRKHELTPALNEADRECRKYITDVRHILKEAIGSTTNADWMQAGFRKGSLAVPNRLDERVILTGELATYLADHPKLENASLNATAAFGKALHQRMADLQSAIDGQKADRKKLSAERDAAGKALRTRVKGLISELRQLLSADDSRWAKFGLDSPADRKRKAAELRAKAKATAAATNITPIAAPATGESKAA